ncbi:hypothetical protein P154DRAFT_312374 [Amniculicola lignicola CBS 123094]|uniref:Uncharacterized protein n=1 Tax=Amniculicola lignicola CBS 123094 TaxID=1392246 RepID=A0A6A5W665_9PLEO|nr:hypothetical protein P154DRAFT_312374 [Amniculicola lignicola CBS 123094]
MSLQTITATTWVNDKPTPLCYQIKDATITVNQVECPPETSKSTSSASLSSSTPGATTTTTPIPTSSTSVIASGATTAAPTPTPPPATPIAQPNNGLAGGAVAGVAIGCLLAGAAIAALVCFFLFRRRRQQGAAAYVQHHVPYNGPSNGPEKAPIAMATAATSNIDNYLPQPVEDDAITKELSRIRDNIKNHARTYYHFEHVQGADILESRLMHIAAATGTSASGLVDLLLNPGTRGEAIRLVIAWVILSKCETQSQRSLLPSDLSALAGAVPGSDGKNPAQTALFSKWKVITGSLLQQRFNSQSSVPTQASIDAINELNMILAPFTLAHNNVNESQRQKNLEMILGRASKLAFLLFSQPGSFRLDFGRDQRGGLVVFPSLIQTIGDQAQPLNPPRLVWEKEPLAEGA